MRLLPLLLVLAACTSSEDTDKTGEGDGTTTTDPGTADTADTGEPEEETRQPPVYSQGACPTFVDGSNETFIHEHGQHNLRIALPDNPEGAPVLFAWHWLGGNANQIMNAMDLPDLAAEQGVIVVAPNSAGSPFEWEFVSPPENNPDLSVFREVLACLHDQFDVDLDRVWTTGMSAGGLWTTYLTMHESEWLAASAPLSGGTLPGSYVTPDDALPVMVTWGGPDDWYGSDVNFEETSLHFSDNLQSDGHFVVQCVHDQGHNLPPDATNLVWTFLSAHVKGAESPWTGGLPSELPAWCEIP